MVLIATDLPEPVVPAISRCGIRARSAITGAPLMSLPSANGRRPVLRVQSSEPNISPRNTVSRLRVGQLDADDVAAGDGGDAHRGDVHVARDVVGQADHPRRLGAGRRLQLVERHHRAGIDGGDAAAHAVILQHRLQQAGLVGQRLLARPGNGAAARDDGSASKLSGGRRQGPSARSSRCCRAASLALRGRGRSADAAAAAAAPPSAAGADAGSGVGGGGAGRRTGIGSSAARSTAARSAPGSVRRRAAPRAARTGRATARRERRRAAAPPRPVPPSGADARPPPRRPRATRRAPSGRSRGRDRATPRAKGREPAPPATRASAPTTMSATSRPKGPSAASPSRATPADTAAPTPPPGPACTGAGSDSRNSSAASSGSATSSAASRAGNRPRPRCEPSRHAQASSAALGSSAAQPKPCSSASDTVAPNGPARLTALRAVAVEKEGSAASWLASATSSARPESPATTPRNSRQRRTSTALTAGEAKRRTPAREGSDGRRTGAAHRLGASGVLAGSR